MSTEPSAVFQPSAEAWLAELDAAIKAYRAVDKTLPVSHAAARAEALARLRKLHLTEGDAERYLDSKPRGRP